MTDIPFSLKNAIESGNCILFIGAGAGYHYYDGEGQRAPSGAELATELAGHYKVDTCNGSIRIRTKLQKQGNTHLL